MSITKRDQILLIGMVILVALFAFIRFSYLPAREEIQSLNITNQELQQEKKQLETEAKKTPLLNKATDQKYANLNKRLPSEDELVPLLTVLDNNCKKYKLPLNAVEYKGAEEEIVGGAQTLVFTLTIKGKVTQLFDYLNALETNQRLISVLDVSLNALKAEKTDLNTDTNEPPTYYIAPPGMPEAKLQRIKFDVENPEETANVVQSVASSLVPDSFEMKITINTYYAPKTTSTDIAKDGTNTGQDSTNKDNNTSSKETKGTKGEV